MNKIRFSEDEKHYLLMLIDEYKHTIDNKETDGASLHRKRKAWMKIQESFNSEPNHVERTVTQLQKCWDNIKTKRRKELAASKQAEFCTDERPVKLKDGDKGDPLGCTESIAMNATDCADSVAVMMSSRSGGTADEDEYQVIEEVVVTLEPDACLPGPREEVSENSLHDLNASGEESFIAAKKRKFETQLKKMTNVSDIENEINAIRKQEAEIRLKIAMEELREAETRTQTTQLQQDFERELLGMKLSYVREVLKGLHRDK